MMRWLVAVFLVATMVGCTKAPPASSQIGTVEQAAKGISADDVLGALRAVAIEATLGGEIPENVSAFGVKGRAIKLGSESLQVYVFLDERDQNLVIIGPDGHSISHGNVAVQVEWIAPPHIFRKRNVIVTLVTSNEELATKIQRVVEGLN
jgi:hypothetical protein